MHPPHGPLDCKEICMPKEQQQQQGQRMLTLCEVKVIRVKETKERGQEGIVLKRKGKAENGNKFNNGVSVTFNNVCFLIHIHLRDLSLGLVRFLNFFKRNIRIWSP